MTLSSAWSRILPEWDVDPKESDRTPEFEERMQNLSKEIMRWAVAVAVVAMFFAVDSSDKEVLAMDIEAEDDEIASLTDGPIVRRQLLHRAGRFELEPKATFTLNDAYVRNGIFGLSASIFLDNAFGLTASAGIGALNFDTSLRRSLEARLDDRGGGELEETAYSQVGWAADVGLTYVPMFGKFSVLNSFFSHYDVHFLGGMALISESALPAAGDDGEVHPELEGIRPGGMFGAGMRFFLSDGFSMNFQVRSYLYPRTEISQGDAEARLGNMVMLSLGVGIFLPGDVQISR